MEIERNPQNVENVNHGPQEIVQLPPAPLVKIYRVKNKAKLADGTVKEYLTTRKYTHKKVTIPDETKAEIIKQYDFGLSITKISKKFNLTRFRILTILNNRDKPADQVQPPPN